MSVLDFIFYQNFMAKIDCFFGLLVDNRVKELELREDYVKYPACQIIEFI